MNKLNHINIFEFEIYSGSIDNLTEKIERDILNNVCNICFAINPLKVILAKEDWETKSALQKADILIPDGVGIIYAAKKKHLDIKERITGIDLMHKICMMSCRTNSSVFIYGSTEENLKKAVINLRKLYPRIKIAGYVNGYEENEEHINRLINKSGADILFVACGSPMQEKYIYKNSENLPNVKFFLGVGGSVDVISGSVKRSPYIIRKANLEWLYRMVFQPRRLPNIKKIIEFLYINHKL